MHHTNDISILQLLSSRRYLQHDRCNGENRLALVVANKMLQAEFKPRGKASRNRIVELKALAGLIFCACFVYLCTYESVEWTVVVLIVVLKGCLQFR